MSGNFYTTPDLYLASAIIARGFEIHWIERSDGKLIFVFLPSHDISVFVEDYFLHKAKLDDTLAMSIAIKNLKNYMYNHQK